MSSRYSQTGIRAGGQTRPIAISVAIRASQEDVWRAITNASELSRWLAPQSGMSPAVGAILCLRWNEHWERLFQVTECRPMSHLLFRENDAHPLDAAGDPLADTEPADLELRVSLAADASSTTLELRCSGFGSGSAWDDEFARLQTALRLVAAELRHYLEHHRGHERIVATALSASDASPDQLWGQLTSQVGLFYSGFKPGIAEGDRIRLSLTTGDVMEGCVIGVAQARHILIATRSLGDGLFRLSIDASAGRSVAQIQASSWRLPEEEMKALEQRLRRGLLRSVSRSRGLLPLWV